MAFKLTKVQIKERDEMVAALREKAEVVTAAKTAWEEAVNDYNGALADANTFVEGLASDFRSQFDDKSERWQEGERGEAASTFVEAWEGVSLDEHDAADTDIDTTADIDALEGLPTAADE